MRGLDWNIHHDKAVAESLEILRLNLICGGCFTQSTLNVGSVGINGVYIQCRACHWDGWVEPTLENGW